MRTRTATIQAGAAVRPESSEEPAVRRRVRSLRLAVRRSLALSGNLSFLIGSVMFLFGPVERMGVWLFILGSAAYLLDALLPSQR